MAVVTGARLVAPRPLGWRSRRHRQQCSEQTAGAAAISMSAVRPSTVRLASSPSRSRRRPSSTTSGVPRRRAHHPCGASSPVSRLTMSSGMLPESDSQMARPAAICFQTQVTQFSHRLGSRKTPASRRGHGLDRLTSPTRTVPAASRTGQVEALPRRIRRGRAGEHEVHVAVRLHGVAHGDVCQQMDAFATRPLPRDREQDREASRVIEVALDVGPGLAIRTAERRRRSGRRPPAAGSAISPTNRAGQELRCMTCPAARRGRSRPPRRRRWSAGGQAPAYL